MKRSRAAYTLIEVLVASALIALVLAGAAAMALIVVTQEETGARVARVVNYQEQAVRLWQLGLEPSTIQTILPGEPAITSLAFDTSTVTLTGVGSVEHAVCTVTFLPNQGASSWSAGRWTAGDPSIERTRAVTAYRPVNR
jgi:prepilin-type N-terminal cleavage/methylation domain-containing protein